MVLFMVSVLLFQGPIVYYVPEGGGRVQFSKWLDFWGVNFENAQNVRGVEILRRMTGLPCKSCQNYIMIEANPRFLRKQAKKIRFVGSLSETKCYPYKAWPRNLSAISPTGMQLVCMYAHTPMHTAEIWGEKRLFYFLKAFLSLNRDKYFALYWCFCVRISFILLLVKWSETVNPNVKPQTLVETFDQANSNSIPEYMQLS